MSERTDIFFHRLQKGFINEVFFVCMLRDFSPIVNQYTYTVSVNCTPILIIFFNEQVISHGWLHINFKKCTFAVK